MSDDNIIDFPSNFIALPANKNTDEGLDEQAHAVVVEAMEKIFEIVGKNDKIKGGVFLAFEEDGSMQDWFFGALTVSAIYIQLDRIKQDLINTLDTLE